MKELWAYFENSFYTTVVSFFLAIVTFVISIHKRRQEPKLRPLSYFLVAYIINNAIIFCDIALQLDWETTIKIVYYSDSIDTIIEFSAFYVLIKNYFVKKRSKQLLRALLPIFITSVSVYFLYYKSVHSDIDQLFLQVIFTIQASILIIACILYYVDLFQDAPKLDLLTHPPFWAITGLSFFLVSTLPYSIISQQLLKINFHFYVQLFTIFEVFYWLLFLMIIKAYLCKPMSERYSY